VNLLPRRANARVHWHPPGKRRTPATRARAVRLYADRLARSAAPDADVSADTAAELRRLRTENAELRRENDILKTASAFFAQAELDRRLK
jgi:transposase-like protein